VATDHGRGAPAGPATRASRAERRSGVRGAVAPGLRSDAR